MYTDNGFFRVIIAEMKKKKDGWMDGWIYHLLNKHDSSAVAYSCTSTFVL